MRGKFILGTKVRRQNGKFIFIFYFPLVKRKYLWHLKKMKSMGEGTNSYQEKKWEGKMDNGSECADRDSITRFLFYLLIILGKVKEWIFEGNCAFTHSFFVCVLLIPLKKDGLNLVDLEGGCHPSLPLSLLSNIFKHSFCPSLSFHTYTT